MSDTPAIEERENGPLVVKGLSSMKNSDGSEVETKPIMALCRCAARPKANRFVTAPTKRYRV